MGPAPSNSAICRDRTTVLTFGFLENITSRASSRIFGQNLEIVFLIFVWAETWANRLIWV